MKKLWVYYLVITLPLLALGVATGLNYISSKDFVIGLLLYVLLYRPTASAYRLVATQVIPKSKFFLNYIPGWNFKYRWFLLFNQQTISDVKVE